MAGPWEDYAPQVQPAQDNALTQTRAKKIWEQAAAKFEQSIARNPADRQRRQRAAFYSDPRIKRLETIIATPQTAPDFKTRVPVTTREDEIKAIARRNVEGRSGQNKVARLALSAAIPALTANLTDEGVGAGTAAFLDEASFGLGDKLRAGLGALTNDRSYEDNLALAREETRLSREQSTTGNILGSIAGAVAGPGAPLKLVKGARLANTAKIAGAGAAYGAGSAAGHDQDILPAAALGAVGGPLLVGAGKLGVLFGQKVGDLIGLSSLPGIMRRYTTMTKEQLLSAAAKFRKETGAEPTLFELLPLGDRQRLAEHVTGRSSETMEQTAKAVRSRSNNVRGEMQSLAGDLVTPQRDAVTTRMASDLAASRGAADPTDLATVRAAASEPLNMDALAQTEARNIMAPHDNTVLFDDVSDLLPQSPMLRPDGTVQMVLDSPEVASAIRSAAGTLRLRPEGEGITGKEVTQILSKLRANSVRGGIEGDNARAAVIHIEDMLVREHPEVAQDVVRMRDAYAARQRMLEGQAEGGRTRTRADVPAGSDGQVREARNAYDTPEGTAGRVLGQSNRLMTDLGGTADDAMRTIDDLANSGNVQRAIAGNLGSDISSGLADASQAQIQSMRSLAAVAKEGNIDDTLNVTQLAHALAGLNPAAMATTKAWALSWLTRAIKVPEPKAKALVGMLFSQNPDMTARAANLLSSSSDDARRFLVQLQSAALAGRGGAQILGAASSDQSVFDELPPEEAPAPEDAAPADEPGPWDEFSTPVDEENLAEDAMPGDAGEDTSNLPYGHAVISELFPDAVVTSDVRDPGDPLSQKNPKSWHANSDQAVDVRPIPGMTYQDFINTILDAGYEIVEARDEVNFPSGHATGPHWHVVIA